MLIKQLRGLGMTAKQKSFSERMGIVQLKEIQIGSIDEQLRIKLWNAIYVTYINKFKNSYQKIVNYSTSSDYYSHMKILWTDYFVKPIDELPVYCNEFIHYLRVYILEKCKWNEIFDFIQFLLDRVDWSDNKEFAEEINLGLEQENSAFRLIGNEIAQITDEQEIKELEEGLENTKGRFDGVNTHLKTALKFLSDRKNPDYRNSIKESISAVESICKIICGSKKADLRSALNRLSKKGIELHSALKVGFEKLYAYTSDAKGVRHALIDFSNATFEDAKYMLVSCTTFVNYIFIHSQIKKITSL